MTCKGFTLAEVLITLVVIGIIAAITVPIIHANYKKKETVSKLKKVYSTLTQVVNRAQFENGTIAEWYTNNKNSTKLFDIYFKPYLMNVKKTTWYKEAGYDKAQPYTFLSGKPYTLGVGNTDSSRTSFLLDDGVFVMVFVSTSALGGGVAYSVQPTVFIDINGGKKPNIVGKDIFLLQITSKKGIQPEGYNYDTKTLNKDFYGCAINKSGRACLEKIRRDGWEIKDDYPW